MISNKQVQEDKWIQIVKCVIGDENKRFKAIQNLRKIYKGEKQKQKKINFLNENYKTIFTTCLDKFSRINQPSPIVESITNLVQPNRSHNQIYDIFECLIDLFQCLEPQNIYDLALTYKQNLVILIYKFFEIPLRKDIKKNCFRWILLKIIDSYDNLQSLDQDYIFLFNFALDIYQGNQNNTVNIGGYKTYFLEIADEYQHNNDIILTFSEIQKILKEKEQSITNYKLHEELAKETFIDFNNFMRNDARNKNGLFDLFKRTWLQIFFNEQEGNAEVQSSITLTETKKNTFVPSLLLVRQLLQNYYEIIKENNQILLKKVDILGFISKFQYICKKCLVQYNDAIKIIELYTKSYALSYLLSRLQEYAEKNYQFPIEDDDNDQIHHKIIDIIPELTFYEINSFDKYDKATQRIYKSSVNQGIKLIKIYSSIHDLFYKDIINCCFKILEETQRTSNEAILTDIQKKSINEEIASPVLESLLFVSLLVSISERDDIKLKLQAYQYPDQLLGKYEEILLIKTKNLIHDLYSQELLSCFPNSYIKHCSSEKEFKIKSEYVILHFLQKICQTQANILDKTEQKSDFIKKINNNYGLKLIFTKCSPKEGHHQAIKIAETQKNFNEWMNCLHFIHGFQSEKNNILFSLRISQILNKIIDLLSISLDNDQQQSITNLNELKAPSRPKYPMPTQTFFQIFKWYFDMVLNNTERNRLEAKLYGIKSMMRVFCKTQSEIPEDKDLIKFVVKFILQELKIPSNPQDIQTILISATIIQTTQEIFLLDYLGLTLLIPNYVRVIESILLSDLFNTLGDDSKHIIGHIFSNVFNLQQNSIKPLRMLKISTLNILKSIMIMGYALPELIILTPYTGDFSKSNQEIYKLANLRDKIINLARRLLERGEQLRLFNTNDRSDYANSGYCDQEFHAILCTICVIVIYCESQFHGNITFSKQSASDFEELLKLYFTQYEHDFPNPEFYIFHVNTITSLAYLIKHDSPLHENIFSKCVKQLLISLEQTLRQFLSTMNTVKKDIILELLNSLQVWILGDKNELLIKDENLLGFLMHIINELEKGANIDDLGDMYEAFFMIFINNYFKFPPKHQKNDNTKSVFKETCFKNLPKNYLEYFDVKATKKINSRIEEDKYENPNSHRDKVPILTLRDKNNPELLTSSALSEQSFIDTKSSYKIRSISDQTLDLKSPFLKSHEKIFNLFKFMTTTEIQLKLLKVNEHELIDMLNVLINNFKPENPDKNTIYVPYSENNIASFLEITKEKQISTRLILRNGYGKFAWEFSYFRAYNDILFHEPISDLNNAITEKFTLGLTNNQSGQSNTRSSNFGSSLFSDPNLANSFSQQNLKSNQDQTKRDDQSYSISMGKANLSNRSSLIVKYSSISDQELETDELERDNFRNMLTLIKETVYDYTQTNQGKWMLKDSIERRQIKLEFEKKKAISKQDKTGQIQDEQDTKKLFGLSKESNQKKIHHLTDRLVMLNKFDGSRLLLAHLGVIPIVSQNNRVFKDIDSKNSTFQTILNFLDECSARETIKAGIVFVANGQDNQTEILKNEKGSQAYDEFISSLGEYVSLQTHLGFQAGLKYRTDGEKSIYYSDPSIEIMFHVITLMPTERDDDQVISKKRHVGNDNVNIIWCENQREYRRMTIASSFNCVQIVIYPFKYGLYRVQINKKDNIGFVFPWLENMLVSKAQLPSLIRLAVINGYRKSRKEPIFKGYTNRLKFIKDIFTEYSAKEPNDSNSIILTLINHITA